MILPLHFACFFSLLSFACALSFVVVGRRLIAAAISIGYLIRSITSISLKKIKKKEEEDDESEGTLGEYKEFIIATPA